MVKLINGLVMILIWLIIINCTSCSIAPPTDPKKFYKLDIKISTKDVVGTGMVILPKKKSYKIYKYFNKRKILKERFKKYRQN